ncbi:MAG: mandelate racemase/muconate lactonizing enzyme family protein [Planctomycetota bacterium]
MDLPSSPLQDVTSHLADPCVIARVELLRVPHAWLCRVTDRDGAAGIAPGSSRLSLFTSLFEQQAEAAIGLDARRVRALCDAMWRHKSAYKFGLPTRLCIASVEMACLDLIGQKSGKSLADLAGGRRRDEVDLYLSHTGRHTSAEKEVALFAPRVEATGCRAIKYKIGGRMSRNADAAPGRSEAVTRALRQAFPNAELWADANGSYDADHAIEVSRMLADHGVAVFEEPCPFDDLDENKRVADAIDMTVAGGEQDHAWPTFRRMIGDRVVDLLQPDAHYVGGLDRSLAVAGAANQAGLRVTPHSPKSGPEGVSLLHVASLVDDVAAFHEWSVHPEPDADWYAPRFAIRNGRLTVPNGPGLGLTYDPDVLDRAELVVTCGR